LLQLQHCILGDDDDDDDNQLDDEFSKISNLVSPLSFKTAKFNIIYYPKIAQVMSQKPSGSIGW